MTIAIATFAVCLAVIAVDRWHRTIVALIGALFVVVSQTISEDQAIEAIDFKTIGLLVGMMIIVKLTETTGLYDYLAIRAGHLTRGRPLAIFWALGLTTAVLSALLDNLTTMLLVVPITFFLADKVNLNPLPLIIVEIIASNIGGSATLIGDPPNIMIAGATGLTFNEFLFNMGPLAVISLGCVMTTLALFYRGKMSVDSAHREALMAINPRDAIVNRRELKRSLPVLIGTLLLFFVHKPLGIEPVTVALLGATVLLIITTQDTDEAFRQVEWSTIFFFIGLFVIVGALEHHGVLEHVATWISDVGNGDHATTLVVIAWFSAIGSGVVDNIPFAAAMIPVVSELQEGAADDSLWWALSVGTCYGGNFTLIAAGANVAAAALIERRGQRISFYEYLKVGVPMTLLSMVIATGYLLVRYA